MLRICAVVSVTDMDSIQCPHCGTQNNTDRSLCANCQTPLTAYAGQLTGEKYDGKLAGKVALLNTRPIAVYLMMAFLTVVTVGWPLRNIVAAFMGRAHLNAETTNYLASAFSSIGPIMITIAMLPVAALLVWIIWQCYAQIPLGWKLGLGAALTFAAFIVFRYRDFGNWTFLWLSAIAALTYLWMRTETKGWFGIS
jgi:hypothetical protein